MLLSANAATKAAQFSLGLFFVTDVYECIRNLFVCLCTLRRYLRAPSTDRREILPSDGR